MNQIFNLKRVHKVNLFAVAGIGLVFLINALLAPTIDMLEVVSPVGIIIFALAFFFIPFPDHVKGFLLGMLPTFTSLALMLVDGYALLYHYLIFISVGMIALYFEAKLVVIYAVIVNIALIAINIALPLVVQGQERGLGGFISFLVLLNGAFVFLFFMNKWGKELIMKAVGKGEEAGEMMEALTVTLAGVENGTMVLGDNTAVMSDNASSTLESSRQVATAMQEIAVGVQEQAESVTEINIQVTAISEDVGEAYNISEHLTTSNKEMMSEVTSGEEEIAHMKSQMHIIDDAIEAAIVTVKELEESMGDIQNFLGVITNISTQTNLLALNASIESARAGEAGKGFAVVADEIRKLAEQSSESVQDINNIVESIGKKTKEAVKTVDQGNDAVDEGSLIIDKITEQYGIIKDSFVKNNDELDREIKFIDQINESFGIVHDKISNIASISEEQSASTEEILATIENQESNIENLTLSLKDIEDLSGKLTSMIEDNHK